jgi:hypothetical protein
MKQENSHEISRKKAARIGKLPTPVLSGSGSRVSLSPTSWSTPVSIVLLKHSWGGFASGIRVVEVRGLPLIHDKTVDEWGTADPW